MTAISARTLHQIKLKFEVLCWHQMGLSVGDSVSNDYAFPLSSITRIKNRLRLIFQTVSTTGQFNLTEAQ